MVMVSHLVRLLIANERAKFVRWDEPRRYHNSTCYLVVLICESSASPRYADSFDSADCCSIQNNLQAWGQLKLKVQELREWVDL